MHLLFGHFGVSLNIRHDRLRFLFNFQPLKFLLLLYLLQLLAHVLSPNSLLPLTLRDEVLNEVVVLLLVLLW